MSWKEMLASSMAMTAWWQGNVAAALQLLNGVAGDVLARVDILDHARQQAAERFAGGLGGRDAARLAGQQGRIHARRAISVRGTMPWAGIMAGMAERGSCRRAGLNHRLPIARIAPPCCGRCG